MSSSLGGVRPAAQLLFCALWRAREPPGLERCSPVSAFAPSQVRRRASTSRPRSTIEDIYSVPALAQVTADQLTHGTRCRP